MPRKTVSVKATGGSGYTFADKVAAGLLTRMLKGVCPFESDLGAIVQLHFETRDVGHVLDDLLLVLKRSDQETRCAISVKSNRQLTNAGFNHEFVKDAWEQWQGVAGATFDRERDLLGLIVGVIDDRVFQEWLGLQQQGGSTTPERLVERLNNDRQMSAAQRTIFQSLRKGPDGDTADAQETARLAARIRILPFSEQNENDHIGLCSKVVLDGSEEEGRKLWSRLLQLAAENRATGGYYDLAKLVRTLRLDFQLRDFPDFEADWKRIESVSAENFQTVRHVIGADIRVAREDEINQIAAAIDKHTVTGIVGESGTGKSALLSQLISSQSFQRVVWLTAPQLSKSSQAELSHAFTLRHAISELIANSSRSCCAIVLDGFEQFEGSARQRALDLVRAVKAQDFVGWKLIITCQPQAWEPTQIALVEAGVTDVHRVDFEKPSFEKIFNVVQHLPAVRALLLRTELQPILRNLMVLDWVLRADIGQRFSAATGWIGETELIDCIWDHWTGDSAMRLARDALLRKLGQLDGERLSGAVHIDSTAGAQLPLLGTLAQEGLIRVDGPSVEFSHDLMADWARYRALLFSRDAAMQTIKDMASIPRWARAIRLYAQSLAERGSGLDAWKGFSAQLTGDDPASQVTRDLCLDALVFATNSESLLEQVWSDLIAEKGHLLHRLLKRLLHVASFPDWRFLTLGIDSKQAEQLEVWFRIPHPVYWYPVLRVLSRHLSDVAEHALLQTAELCALWLRTMPDGMPGRSEAGLVALALAKEAQGLIAEDLHFSGKDQVVYEALLSAAREFPEEVTQIALELSGRRDEPQHAVQRASDAEGRRAKFYEEWRQKHPEEERARRNFPGVTFSSTPGPMRGQDPDGPAREVSDGFRSAVLDTPALNALIATRPLVAREVLLAVCIDEPKPSDPYNHGLHIFETYGLSDWRRGYPPLYWKGPFLKFLQDAPDSGLDAIVRLVNYATRRWFEDGSGRSLTDEQRRDCGLEFIFNGQSRWWIGDSNVYGWNRYIPMHADAVSCALMALEKWLYDQVEQEKSVTSWVQYICQHGDSLALAGVLISLGLKYPALFTRELQPFLGNLDIYQCQLSWALNEAQGAWSIGLAGQGEPATKLATEWHTMRHRRLMLQEIAPWLMLQHSGTLSFLTARRNEWLKRLQRNQDHERLEVFLARFDPSNYTQTPQGDGTVLIEMRLPPDLEEKTKIARQEGEIKMLSLTLAGRARRCLSGRDSLSAEEVPGLVEQLRNLVRWRPSSEDRSQEQYRINSIAGAIAVLIAQHREWLSQNPEVEKWCLDTARELKPVGNVEHDTPMSFYDQSAESFLGEAGVALLQESDEEWVWRLAIAGLTGFYYSSTFQTMCAAYFRRATLGDKFDELVNVVTLWSALRRAADRESGYQATQPLLERYREVAFRRHAAGRLQGRLIPLRRIGALGNRLVERISRRSMSPSEKRVREAQRAWQHEHRRERKLDRDIPHVDLEVLRKGFGFVAAMVREPTGNDEERLRHYVHELFHLEMSTLPRPEPTRRNCEVEGTPYEFDVWIMPRVVEFIVHAKSLDVAREYYRPLIELGPMGRYWVEDFLQSWITAGLEIAAADLESFAIIWKDIVGYAMTLAVWQPGDTRYWCRAESLAVDLVGLHETASTVLGQAKYKPLVAAMSQTFEQWAISWIKYPSAAAWFAHFLPTESGEVLLPLGIKKLAEVAESFEDRDWHDHHLGVVFTEVLDAGWKRIGKHIESQPQLKESFLHLLTVLCARQLPEALHLRERVTLATGQTA